ERCLLLPDVGTARAPFPVPTRLRPDDRDARHHRGVRQGFERCAGRRSERCGDRRRARDRLRLLLRERGAPARPADGLPALHADRGGARPRRLKRRGSRAAPTLSGRRARGTSAMLGARGPAMRTAIVALLALTAGAFALLASDVFDWRREVPGAPADGDTEARLSAVEARVEELARALDRLTAQLARAPGEARVALPSNAPAPTGPAGPERLDPRGDAVDPHWYLVQYERSVDGGGSGSEYFRLAVDAYAPELLAAITALVRDASLPTALRANLAAMLGTPRFAGNQHVIGVLVATLRDGCPPEIATVALQGLAVVG